MPAIQLDHGARVYDESKVFDMLKQSTNAGIFDTWLHTNGQMLNEKMVKN